MPNTKRRAEELLENLNQINTKLETYLDTLWTPYQQPSLDPHTLINQAFKSISHHRLKKITNSTLPEPQKDRASHLTQLISKNISIIKWSITYKK